MRTSGAALAAVILVPALIFSLCVFVIIFGAGSAVAACLPGAANTVVVDQIASDARVGTYDREQIVNAAHIANAAVALGLPPAAQTLGIQAAIGESSLRVIDYGDAVGPDSRGLFQQRDNGAWGSYEDRMDPSVSASNFFAALQGVGGWEDMEPSLAINRVQRNADPNHYTRFRADAVAIVAFLSGTDTVGETAGCAVSGDARTLANGLLQALEEGRLTLLEQKYAQQIRDVADGTAAENCRLDVRILQVIALALDNFDRVGVSDLNRQCTGSLLGAGTGSSHWIKGGGHAVDFYSLNGAVATGCDANSLRLLSLLDPIVPLGARAGQVQCRSVTFRHITQFVDSPNHLHFDLAYADGPLALV